MYYVASSKEAKMLMKLLLATCALGLWEIHHLIAVNNLESPDNLARKTP